MKERIKDVFRLKREWRALFFFASRSALPPRTANADKIQPPSTPTLENCTLNVYSLSLFCFSVHAAFSTFSLRIHIYAHPGLYITLSFFFLPVTSLPPSRHHYPYRVLHIISYSPKVFYCKQVLQKAFSFNLFIYFYLFLHSLPVSAILVMPQQPLFLQQPSLSLYIIYCKFLHMRTKTHGFHC